MPADAVIINADDLGLWPSVDKGIFEAWTSGAISDTSIFATVPNLAEVVRRATAYGIPVGIHLNLTYGSPLSNARTVPSLVSPEGTFMKRKVWIRPLSVVEIRRELTKQVEAVLDLGVTISHLDTHHHVHFYPEVLDVVIALAQRFKLPVRSVDGFMRDALREEGITTTDHFTMNFFGAAATTSNLIELVDQCPGGTLEVMCHPGYTDSNLPSSYNDGRAQELLALTDPEWKGYLSRTGVKMISFADLTPEVQEVQEGA